MALTISRDIVDTIGRADYCFWIADPTATDRTLPTSIVTLLVVVTTLNFALLGRSNSLLSAAIYTLYLILALSIAGVLTFVRQRRIESTSVQVLIEAYVVMLLITMLALMHNLFVPIAFFGQDTNVDRGPVAQLVIVYCYTIPAGVYLYLNSRNRLRAKFAPVGNAAESANVDAQFSAAHRELILWSIIHYAVIAFLIWMFLFSDPDHIEGLTKLIPQM